MISKSRASSKLVQSSNVSLDKELIELSEKSTNDSRLSWINLHLPKSETSHIEDSESSKKVIFNSIKKKFPPLNKKTFVRNDSREVWRRIKNRCRGMARNTTVESKCLPELTYNWTVPENNREACIKDEIEYSTRPSVFNYKGQMGILRRNSLTTGGPR